MTGITVPQIELCSLFCIGSLERVPLAVQAENATLIGKSSPIGQIHRFTFALIYVSLQGMSVAKSEASQGNSADAIKTRVLD